MIQKHDLVGGSRCVEVQVRDGERAVGGDGPGLELGGLPLNLGLEGVGAGKVLWVFELLLELHSAWVDNGMLMLNTGSGGVEGGG